MKIKKKVVVLAEKTSIQRLHVHQSHRIIRRRRRLAPSAQKHLDYTYAFLSGNRSGVFSPVHGESFRPSLVLFSWSESVDEGQHVLLKLNF